MSNKLSLKAVNINVTVWVKLTDEGKKLLREHYESHRINASKVPKLYRKGKVSFQLWDLMHIFGPNLYNGCTVPFVNNEISIDFDSV